ncbi:ATP-binding domain-containing protein, partial [Clostridium perfringens]|nr:ATP-binding domain-containing protein [Clostridium perfringens]
MANDFNIFNIDGRMHSLTEVSIDERNLLYVAVTRAKKSLILSSTIVKLLELYGDHHLSVISSKVLKEKGVNFKCKVSGEEFEPG